MLGVKATSPQRIPLRLQSSASPRVRLLRIYRSHVSVQHRFKAGQSERICLPEYPVPEAAALYRRFAQSSGLVLGHRYREDEGCGGCFLPQLAPSAFTYGRGTSGKSFARDNGGADDRPPFRVRLHFDRRYRDHRVALAYIGFHRLGPLVLAA